MIMILTFLFLYLLYLKCLGQVIGCLNLQLKTLIILEVLRHRIYIFLIFYLFFFKCLHKIADIWEKQMNVIGEVEIRTRNNLRINEFRRLFKKMKGQAIDVSTERHSKSKVLIKVKENAITSLLHTCRQALTKPPQFSTLDYY